MAYFFILQKNSKNSTSLLKVQFISRLKEAGEFLHNNVKMNSNIKSSKEELIETIDELNEKKRN